MKTRFAVQPFDLQFGNYLDEVMSGEVIGRIESLLVIVAFAKMSGVDRISSLLGAEDTKKTFMVGIDVKGTSREAVKSLYNHADRVYVFHSRRSDVTFHPKIYFFKGEAGGLMISGSPNLTAGGLYTNVEFASISTFSKADRNRLSRVRRKVFRSLVASKKNLRLLNDENIRDLLRKLPSEKDLRRAITKKKGKREKGLDAMFGSGDFPKAPKVTTTEIASHPGKVAVAAGTGQPGSLAAGGISKLKAGFWKRLSKFDVSPGSAPGQMIIPIGFLEMFPDLGNEQITESGGRQSDVELSGIFVSSEGENISVNPRVILYEPAPNHPRPNKEIRFTFRNHAVNPGILKAGDILVFSIENEGGKNKAFNAYQLNNPEDLQKFHGKFGTLPI